MGIPFRQAAVLQAIDSSGEPVEGLLVAAHSLEASAASGRPLSPPLFQMGTAAGPDYQVSAQPRTSSLDVVVKNCAHSL